MKRLLLIGLASSGMLLSGWQLSQAQETTPAPGAATDNNLRTTAAADDRNDMGFDLGWLGLLGLLGLGGLMGRTRQHDRYQHTAGTTADTSRR